jgi:trimeric autotransporter adhesin
LKLLLFLHEILSKQQTLNIMKTKVLLFFIILTSFAGWGQVSITGTGSGNTYTQDFNTLANSGTSSTVPTGWAFLETLTNANTTYTAGTGSATGGDTYSFGAASPSTERAFGVLKSSNFASVIGVSFTNNTGTIINGLVITYKGETWRIGAASRIDRLDFQYSTNATSLSTGTWTDFDALDYSNPGQATGSGSQQHSSNISSTITSLSIANGTTFWLRWNDLDATGSDDGMGIDDFSLYANASSSPPTLTPDTTLNTVDNNLDISFTDDATWRTAITAVKIGATTLTPSTDYVITAGNLQLKPSGLNALLTTSGTKAVSVVATGYTDATVSQVINAGAPTTNSTATISAALAVGTSRTITCTAKDQYNNLVSGYTFAYDVTITNANGTTAESYTIDGTAFTVTDTNGNPVTATTNASGVATFTAVLPATIDASDGISIQVQLNNDTTNVGTAFSFTQLLAQSITFGALSTATYGDALITLSASASSGLTVTYTSSNPAVASVSGNTVTILSNGIVTITASQAGNASYNAASNVPQTLTINQKALTVSPVSASNKVYNGTNAATITGALVGIVGADVVTFIGTGTFASSDTAIGIAVTPGATLGGANAGKYILIQPTGLTANITQATQTISVAAAVTKTLGDADFPVGATSATSAINALTYSSSNPAVATISASGVITIVGIGTTTITVAQGASLNYFAATNGNLLLTVIAAPIAAWQLNGNSGNETSVNAGTLDSNLNTSTLIRGSGLSASSLANVFSATNFSLSGTKNGEITANKFISFTLNAKTGYKISLSTLDVRFRRSGTGPNTFRWQYSTDGMSFTDIGSADISYTSTTTGGDAQTQLSLSGISALQNVPYTSTITLRLVAWGATNTSGTFAIGRSLTNTTSDYSLQIGGTVDVKEAVWENATWSNSVGPDATLDAIIKDTYTIPTTGTFTAKNLTINTGGLLTVNGNSTLTIAESLINNLTADKVVFSSGSSLLQTNSAASNTGSITYKRTTTTLAKDLDFVYWGSPVANQTLANMWMTSVNDTFYSFDNTATPQDWAYAAPSTIMREGKGYIARAVAGTGTPTWNPTNTWTSNFIGKPNNGDYTAAVYNNGTTADNLLANPYPSAIDIIAFRNDIDNKAFLTGNFYFWTHSTAINSNNYTSSDYAVFNIALDAATGTASGATPAPDKYVDAAQGFFAEASTSGTVTFKNAHRVSANNNAFYRTANNQTTVNSDKFWVNLSSNNGIFKQLLVAYADGATTNYDENLDSKTFDSNLYADFYSIIPNQKLVIQSRPAPFTSSDFVQLGFKTTVEGNFKIELDHFDSLFNNKPIYLQDNLLGIDSDLSQGSYTFHATAGTHDNRFVLKYSSALATNNVNYENNILVAREKNNIRVKSTLENIKNITIFDILGRNLYEATNINTADHFINKNLNNQTLLVKITLVNDIIVTKKI